MARNIDDVCQDTENIASFKGTGSGGPARQKACIIIHYAVYLYHRNLKEILV